MFSASAAIASAAAYRIRPRSAPPISTQPLLSKASCAALTAASTSSALASATSVIGESSTGLWLVYVAPPLAGRHSPPMNRSREGKVGEGMRVSWDGR